jgi:hypothetical protein
MFLGLDFGGGGVKLKPGSLPARAITDTFMLQTGLVFRRFFNGPKSFLSPYVSAGLDIQGLLWN